MDIWSIGESFDTYRGIIEDYRKLPRLILKEDVRRDRETARRMEREAGQLLSRCEAFGHRGIEDVLCELSAYIEHSVSGDKSSAKIIFIGLDEEGLMRGGIYWKTLWRWEKCRELFIRDEKRMGVAANTFLLSGIVEDLREWCDFFAHEVFSWFCPANYGHGQYQSAGALNRYIKSSMRPYIDRESFADIFKRQTDYVKFISLVYTDRLGLRPGVQYAAIVNLLLKSDNIIQRYSRRSLIRILCSAFALPDFSSYYPRDRAVMDAMTDKKFWRDFNFLLKKSIN